MTNPYTDFVKSLTDEQLDAAFHAMHTATTTRTSMNDLEFALIAEWESRERSTKLTFYTPDVTAARQLLKDEQEEVTFAYSAGYSLRGKRLFNGWSPELEAAVVKLIIQLIEQL